MQLVPLGLFLMGSLSVHRMVFPFASLTTGRHIHEVAGGTRYIFYQHEVILRCDQHEVVARCVSVRKEIITSSLKFVPVGS